MNLKEATDIYGIPVPDDIDNYDKEYYRKFDEMYLKSFFTAFYSENIETKSENKNIERESENKNSDRNKTAIILGGQSGAGKSSIVALTKRKFREDGRRIIVIDDDQYRKFFPNAKQLLEKCPEHYVKITATATNLITPKILKFASDNGYNFIFDGTMKNTRILETMKTWPNDYNKEVKVMATSRLESLLSIYERNEELMQTYGDGRLISIDVHDETYNGLESTLGIVENSGIPQTVEVYKRGINPLYPQMVYSSQNKEYSSAVEALKDTRMKDEKQCLGTISERMYYLENPGRKLNSDEKAKIELLKKELRKYVELER